MDDARIRQLTEEVLHKLGTSRDPEVADLEGRLAALESAVRRLQGGGAPEAAAATVVSTTIVVAPATPGTHPSLQLVAPKPGGERCCLEPDKPCVGSGQCRALGH